MGVQTEVINNRVDRMQANRGLFGLQAWDDSEWSDEVEMLQMAAHLRSLRPGADTPRPEFVASLRARMLASIVETR